MAFDLDKLKISYHQVQEKFKVPEKNKVILKCKLLEKIFLGRFQWCGYENNPSNSLRLIASIIQTLWACLALWITTSIVLSITNNHIVIKTDSAIVSITGVIALILSACIVSERANLYAKFNYLALLFNDIIKVEIATPNLCHRVGCLAHDILVMEMWNHRSFNAAFNEALIWAVLVKHNYSLEIAVRDLNEYKIEGIKYEEAKELIAELITVTAPI